MLNSSEQRPLISNFTTMTIIKLCCHNFSQSEYIMIFFCLVFLIDLLTYPYQNNFPKMLLFQIVTICPLSLPSRSSRCPRFIIQLIFQLKKTSFKTPLVSKLPYFREQLSRQLFFFEAHGATIIQGRQLFKGGNYCFLVFLGIYNLNCCRKLISKVKYLHRFQSKINL